MANSRAWKFARLLNSDGKVKADKTELRDGAAFTGNVDFNQGADVTGDITVTGNVDGVDVSAFKSTYDSHNHDDRYYTETEADSRFVNVTGDTMTSPLTIDTNTGSMLRLSATNSSPWAIELDRDDATASKVYNGGGFWQFQHRPRYASNVIFDDGYHPNADKWTTARTLSLSGDASGSVSWDGSANATLSVTVANNSHTHTPSNITNLIEGTNFSGTYPVLFGIDETTGRIFENNDITFNGTTNVLTINGGTAWHSANDGSGSGLDADLLDGVQGSAYMRSDTSDTMSGNLTVTGYILTDNIRGRTNQDLTITCGESHGHLSAGSYNDEIIRLAGEGGVKVYASSNNLSSGLNRETTVINTGGHFIAAGNVTAYSDIRLKDNVQTIPDALDKVLNVRGVTYTLKDEDEGQRYAGVIAQEVEKVLPEVVMTDDKDTKTVAYGNMVGLLIEAIKEQQTQIDELKAKLEV